MLTFDADNFETVNTKAGLKQWAKRLASAKSFAFDTETTGLDVFKDELVGVALALEDRGKVDACYIPIAHHHGRNLPGSDVLGALAPTCLDPKKPKVLHNALFDGLILGQKRYSFPLRCMHDTMYMAYVLHGHTLPSLGMDYLAKKFLKWTTIEFKDVVLNRPGRKDFRDVPLKEATDYAAEDTAVTFVLAKLFQQELKKEGLWEVYTRDREMIPVQIAMKQTGIKIDVPLLQKLGVGWTKTAAVAKRKAERVIGRPINLNSSQQVLAVLEERGIEPPIDWKTKKPTTAADELEELDVDDPFIDALLEFKRADKLRSTYAEALPKKVMPHSGRVHTNFPSVRTKTGRLASNDPNLQNIPIRTKEGRQIRSAFIADKGMSLVCGDYSQLEYRVLAHITEQPSLIKAFVEDIDVHRQVMADILGVLVDLVTEEERGQGKTVNFAAIYGAGARKVAKTANITVERAMQILDAYWEKLPLVQSWKERVQDFGRENGYVETMFGRRVYLPDILSRNSAKRSKDERVAVNGIVQGSATGDLMRMAMVRVHNAFQAKPAWKARILLTVHDELVVECLTKHAEQVRKCMVHEMQTAADHLVKWRVPIKVKAAIGQTWGEAK